MQLSWAYGAGLCVFVGGGGDACCFAEKLTRFKAHQPCGLTHIQFKCFSNFDKNLALESKGQRSRVSLASLWSLRRLAS